MQRNFVIVFLCITVTLCTSAMKSYATESTGKVALFPFHAEHAGKYENLKNALHLMLAGRLATRDGISVVDNTLTATEQESFVTRYPEAIEAVFAKMNADFIGSGEMILEGTRLNLRMRFFSKDGRVPIRISSYADNEQQVMPAIDALASKIGEKLFGLRAPGSAVITTVEKQKGIDAFQTEHPDRSYKEKIISGVAVFAEDEGMMISQDNMLRRRAELAGHIVALSVADLDSNGIDEIVVASEKNIWVYHYNRGILELLSRYSLQIDIKTHAMNIADLDGDGQSEIYVSAVEEGRFSSMILTWSMEAGVRVVADKIRFAIRPIDIPRIGYRLIGQAASIKKNPFFEPGLYYMNMNMDVSTDPVVQGEKLFLPRSFNLFDFVYADIDGDGLYEKVAITGDMKMVVYNRENRLMWISKDDYGGRNLYVGERWVENDSAIYGEPSDKGEEINMSLQYLPVPLLAMDINGDGKDEILSGKNTLSTYRVLVNLRNFSGGKMVCLGWNGQAMRELWQTDTLDGFIADFDLNIEPLPENGKIKQNEMLAGTKMQLFVGQVAGQGVTDLLGFLADSGSLVVYDFDILNKTTFAEGAQ